MRYLTFISLAGLSQLALAQESVFTDTQAATTATYSGEQIAVSGSTRTFKDTTLIVTATTSDLPATTITRPPVTETITSLPSILVALKNDRAASDIEKYASTLASLDPAQVTKAASDLDQYYKSLQTDTPYIIYQAPQDLMQQFVKDEIDELTYREIYAALLEPWDATLTSEVGTLLTANPSLSSEITSYLDVAKTFLASSQSAVGSIVSKDLSLTGAPPSFVSEISSATAASNATTTGASRTSSGFAVATGGAQVLLNAGAAAAGMAVLALL